MANLKELRNRISSVASTQKITRAMQMVAASKLRKAQDAVESTRPYSDKLFQVVGNLSREMEGDDNAPKLLVGNGKSQRYLFVIATSERGLCGGFNSSITRLASQKARELINVGKEVEFICVGKKGKASLSSEFGDKIIDFFDFSEVRNLSFVQLDQIAKKIIHANVIQIFLSSRKVYSPGANIKENGLIKPSCNYSKNKFSSTTQLFIRYLERDPLTSVHVAARTI